MLSLSRRGPGRRDSRRAARALGDAEPVVELHDAHGAQGTADEARLAKLARRGLTTDRPSAYRDLERMAVARADARLLARGDPNMSTANTSAAPVAALPGMGRRGAVEHARSVATGLPSGRVEARRTADEPAPAGDDPA